ncbi:ribbon-helix-helix domain-containing protein [Nisaea sp.]|uniref:ribbon-helix-helix domain-containing protein n=1 Tax=Nisaea sp. TaxID=2024842 RepID=UPI0032987C11
MSQTNERDPTRIRKRTVTVSGHVTSVSLEEAFWDVLKGIAAARDLSINSLVSEVDATRSGNLSSALRVFVLSELLGGTPSVPE